MASTAISEAEEELDRNSEATYSILLMLQGKPIATAKFMNALHDSPFSGHIMLVGQSLTGAALRAVDSERRNPARSRKTIEDELEVMTFRFLVCECA